MTRSAHKISLAKVFIDKKTSERPRAKKMLEQVAEDDLHLAPVAHYYLAHLLIRTRRPKDRSRCPELFEHLLRAREGFEEEIRRQSALSSTTSFIAQKYADKSR